VAEARYGAAMRNRDVRREQLRTAGPWVLDGLLAAAAAAAGTALLATMLPLDPGSPRAVAAYLLVDAHTLPIALRRRFPLATLIWALATGAAFAALGLSLVTLSFTILIYVDTVAARCPRRLSMAGLAATEAVLLGVWLTRPHSIGDASTLVLDGLILAAAWWLGDGTRRRQEAITAAQERAAELQRAREELARRAVTEERLRIARELHDVVAHSMSIIAVQSGVGAHVLDSQPEEARKALAAEVARAGVRVEVRIEGTPARLPAGLDLSAYRIVQEALTNVVRHAGPATARVAVRYTPGGHGIAGMRERAALYGGTLEAAPLPGGGFRVAADLPVDEGFGKVPR
jgi:signal transduction histidine kinase